MANIQDSDGGTVWSEKAPEAKEVNLFHTNADTDTDGQALHHTLGPGKSQAASGAHTHRGDDSSLLFEGRTITGSRTNGTALLSIIGLLEELGAVNGTTA